MKLANHEPQTYEALQSIFFGKNPKQYASPDTVLGSSKP